MTPRLVFRPQAEAEVLDARAWYERERVGLGAVFAAAVETTVTAIIQDPLAYPLVKVTHGGRSFVDFHTLCIFALSTRRSLSWRSCMVAGIHGIGDRDAESNFRRSC